MSSTAAPLIIIIILLLFPFFLPVSSQKQSQSCKSSFQCGSLGVLSYPFTTFFRPDCGLCMINCTFPTQTLQLGQHGPWYNLNHSFSTGKVFLVEDLLLLHATNSDSCDVFDSRFQLPRSPSVSVTLLYNETLWRCPNGTSFPPPDISNVTVYSIRTCGNYSFYVSVDTQFLPGNNFNCSALQYPTVLVVEITSECSRCITDGGLCQDTIDGKFKCVNHKEERRKLTRLLVLGILVGSIIFNIVGLVFWQIKKIKYRSSAFASTNTSPDPSEAELAMSKMYLSVPVFPYSELEIATKNFDPAMELGHGAYGTVYYGKLTDGREVAVKRLHERKYKQLQQFLNEIEILTRLRHQNLVSLYGCSPHSQELLLVYEYVPNRTIADHLYGDQAKFGILTWPVRMSIAIETARALSYLHASDIIHRDVKTKNILLDGKFGVKVADFGLSKLFPMDATHVSTIPQGTPGYLDPEYNQCYQLTDKSDVYSFGVVLLELISSMPAIDINRQEVNLSTYAMAKIQFGVLDEVVDPRLGFKANQRVKKMTTLVAELAFQCLQHDKDFRPSMADVHEALMRIESTACEETKKEAKGGNDSMLEETEIDHVWLLRNAQNKLGSN